MGFGVVGSWIVSVVNFVENFVNTSDQVIVVAMITGAVSITGVVISSIVAKIVEYKYNVKSTYMISVKNHISNL